MRQTRKNCSEVYFVVACLTCLLIETGCDQKRAPSVVPVPSPPKKSESRTGGDPTRPPPVPMPSLLGQGPVKFEFYRWKEGLNVLLVMGDPTGNTSFGSVVSLSLPNSVCTVRGHVTFVADGPKHVWQLETTDGRNASFSIDGKNYDLAKGALVLLRQRETQLEAIQFQRDLSAVQWSEAGCADYLKHDNELKKFLDK